MGKFPNSDLHDRYSDFHYELSNIDPRYKRLYCADVDRLWIEYDFYKRAVVAVLDIKRERDFYREEAGCTATELGIYNWFKEKGAQVFIVYISEDFRTFLIRPFKENSVYLVEGKIFFADWLLSLREGSKGLEKFPQVNKDSLVVSF